jgi:hypothetical protein
MVLLNSKRRAGNKDQPINVFVIIDQFCCITKNSQTQEGLEPHDLTIAALFFLTTP